VILLELVSTGQFLEPRVRAFSIIRTVLEPSTIRTLLTGQFLEKGIRAFYTTFRNKLEPLKIRTLIKWSIFRAKN
jgi:hypothetical protein